MMGLMDFISGIADSEADQHSGNAKHGPNISAPLCTGVFMGVIRVVSAGTEEGGSEGEGNGFGKNLGLHRRNELA